MKVWQIYFYKWLRGVRLKLWLWWTRPLKCKFGFHFRCENEFSYALCSGVITFHCRKCQKAIERIPLDDCNLTLNERLQFILKLKENWPQENMNA